MIYVKIYSHMWHFCDSHYHIGLFEGPIFKKSSIDYELTRAGSSEILGSKNFFGYLLDYKTGKCNKKRVRHRRFGLQNSVYAKNVVFLLFFADLTPLWGGGGAKIGKMYIFHFFSSHLMRFDHKKENRAPFPTHP